MVNLIEKNPKEKPEDGGSNEDGNDVKKAFPNDLVWTISDEHGTHHSSDQGM